MSESIFPSPFPAFPDVITEVGKPVLCRKHCSIFKSSRQQSDARAHLLHLPFFSSTALQLGRKASLTSGPELVVHDSAAWLPLSAQATHVHPRLCLSRIQLNLRADKIKSH